MAAVRMTAEARREQIIDVAAELFAKQGFKGTTTRQVAEDVGITEALVFRYFTTKESLYSAIIEARTSEPTPWDSGDIQRAVADRDDFRVFETAATALLTVGKKNPGLMRLLLYSALEDHKMSNLFFQSRMTNLVVMLADYIETRQGEGLFGKSDPMMSARGFLGMINHQLLMRGIFKHEAYLSNSLEDIAAFYTTLFLNGVNARQDRVTVGA